MKPGGAFCGRLLGYKQPIKELLKITGFFAH
jgi:hypothetical protein